MTFEQAKDQVAVKHGHADWKIAECRTGRNEIDKMYTEAAELYAKSKAKSESIKFAEWCSEEFNRSYPKENEKILWFPKVTFNGVFKKEHHTTDQLFYIWLSKKPEFKP